MLKQLLQNLNSKDESVRETALQEVRALPPQQLLHLLKMDRQLSKRASRYVVFSLLIAQIVNTILFLLIHFSKGYGHYLALLGCMPVVGIFVGIGFALHDSGKRTQTRHSIIRIIEELDDERFVPAALSMLHSPDFIVQGENMMRLLDALKLALPNLRCGQADFWKDEQMRALLSLLNQPEDDIGLALVILKALEQIGDERALPRIRFLAEDDYIVDDTDSRLNAYLGTTDELQTHLREHIVRRTRIQQAALECLPYLEARYAEKQQAQTLLRASSVSEVVPSNTLLRPARAAAEAMPAEQLLHPVGHTPPPPNSGGNSA